MLLKLAEGGESVATAKRNHGKPLTPYGSARDLPSFQELDAQIRAIKPITRVFARDQRANLTEIQRQMDLIVDTVDEFYRRLGQRYWLFHDPLPVDDVASLLATYDDLDSLEKAFVALEQDAILHGHLCVRLNAFQELRPRMPMIDEAKRLYELEHYSACTLLLIAIMDGFVNDIDPSARKGLHARDPESMVAWDSVVGHHKGLSYVLEHTFKKSFSARKDEEAFDVYRNGIVHGMIVNFNNFIIATKAWNLLFGVADWARAEENRNKPVEKPPTFRETISRVYRHRVAQTERQQRLDQWQPVTLAPDDPAFSTHEMFALTGKFLRLWGARNYGTLIDHHARQLFEPTDSSGKKANRVRNWYEYRPIGDFEITKLDNPAPAVWHTYGKATVDGVPSSFECRWICEDDEGFIDFGAPSAHWKLIWCKTELLTQST